MKQKRIFSGMKYLEMKMILFLINSQIGKHKRNISQLSANCKQNVLVSLLLTHHKRNKVYSWADVDGLFQKNGNLVEDESVKWREILTRSKTKDDFSFSSIRDYLLLVELNNRIGEDVAHINGSSLLKNLGMFVEHQPADMCKEESTVGVMWISVCLRVLVMNSMISHPIVKRVLSSARIRQHKQNT